MPNGAETENALVKAMTEGDEAALGSIIDRYTGYVWAIVWNIVGGKLNREDGKAVVSEVFYTLWENAGKIRPGKLKSYLSAIARSRSLDALRAARQYEPLEDDMIWLPTSGPEDETLRREAYAALQQALAEMPEPDRDIFIRHYYLYQTTAEIAGVLGMNVSTVQSKLRRGREALRRKLTEGGYFGGKEDI